MFESTALGRSYTEKEYAAMEEELRNALFSAQRSCLQHQVPVLVIIAGVDGAGRGAVVNMLSEWMDAKGISNHTFWMQTDEEKARPEAWRYWRNLPGKGEIGVFFGGWYEDVNKFVCGTLSEINFERRMRRWVQLEQTLAATGTLIVKLWLHIDKKNHRKRLKERQANKENHYFTPYDKKSAENYSAMVNAAARAITLTDTVNAPWTIIDACDPRFRNASVARALTTAMEGAVARKMALQTARQAILEAANNSETPPVEPNASHQISALSAIDLNKTCEHATYKKELAALQADISQLSYQAFEKGISTTLVFEGWDAAGKGGAIRRLTAGIDSRITRVIPISAPSDEELAHNYLWRFWRQIPLAGFVCVYDRSWYGRVLVERVEKLTPPVDWKRAYAEINDFEEQLQENNNIVLKFWLHISPEEQLRRFQERESISWKNYKITAEDWRNREKHEAYLEAADEMFLRTSTEYAPWHIIPAQDKKYARIEVLRTYRDALKKAVKRKFK